MIITWTSTEKISYNKNIAFLIKLWNLKVAQEFILEVESTMNLIKTNPNCFKTGNTIRVTGLALFIKT